MTSGIKMEGNLQELAAQKEQEWKEVQRLQTQALESALLEKEKLLNEERKQFVKLKDDFKYNLKLLMERDQELERYDNTVAKIKVSLQSKDSEVSDLKIQIDDLKKALKGHEDSQEDLQKHYQQKMRENNQEIEHYKKMKDEEINQERKDVEVFRMNLQRQVRQLEEELDMQRRELSSGFDEAMKRREKEYRTKIEELSAMALSHEMKAKFLSKEVDLVRLSADKIKQELASSDETIKSLEKQLKEKEWELQDTTGTSDARIAELEHRVRDNEMKLKRAIEEFKRKHEQLDKYAREKENAVSVMKDSLVEKERHLEGEIRNLRAHLEERELDRRKSDWQHQDEVKEKDAEIENLKEALAAGKSQSDLQMSKVTQGIRKMEMEIQELKENEVKLKSDFNRRKEDVERYKKELTHAAAQYAELERSKAQLDVDWQRRYEDAERSQYSRSEELIEKLTKSKDEALALVKERDREMDQKDQLLRSVQISRDQAMATLRKHNLKISVTEEMIPPLKDSDERKLKSLEDQNDALKSVIQRMREEMESLTAAAAASHQTERGNKSGGVYTDDYAKNMEKEIKLLKAEKRDLRNQLELAMKENRTHIQQGSHKQESINLTDQTRTHSHEIAMLKQQIAKLESSLQNSKVEALENQAKAREEDFQRGGGGGGGILGTSSRKMLNANMSVIALQAKLKTAIHHISRLVKERQQLIELSNRLRSEVARYKKDQGGVDRSEKANEMVHKERKPVSPREMVQKLDRQLNAVEQLQYSLTTKELQMMQKELSKDHERTEVIQVQLSSSSSAPSSPNDHRFPEDFPSQDHPQPRSKPGQQQFSEVSLEVQEPSSMTQSSSNESFNQTRTPLMMSSVGEDSMRDIWKLLELPPSPSPVPDYTAADAGPPQVPMSNDVLTGSVEVIGSRTQMSQKPHQRQANLSSAAAGKIRPQQPVKRKKPQIRNYNQRDEVT